MLATYALDTASPVDAELVIETPFTITQGEVTTWVDPRTAVGYDRVLPLLRSFVRAVEHHRDQSLRLTLDDSSITVLTSSEHESWHLVGSGIDNWEET